MNSVAGYYPTLPGSYPEAYGAVPPYPVRGTAEPGWFFQEASGPNKASFVCRACGKSYLHYSSVQKHIRFECGKEPQFQCSFCPHRSKLKSNLKKHLRNSHNWPPP